MSENIDLVILLHGNNLPLVVAKEKMHEMDTILQTTTGDEDKKNRWLCFADEAGYYHRVHPRAIQGWFFRERKVNPTDKALSIMEKMEKKMPDPGAGDEWKNQE